jgi:hypothetical protein
MPTEPLGEDLIAAILKNLKDELAEHLRRMTNDRCPGRCIDGRRRFDHDTMHFLDGD